MAETTDLYVSASSVGVGVFNLMSPQHRTPREVGGRRGVSEAECPSAPSSTSR